MIPIKNIYYMLSYAFKLLDEKGFKDLETEEFENAADICAAILIKGVSKLLKRGLGREYLLYSEPLSMLKGKIDFSESINSQSLLKQQLVCSYDEFSVNSYMNRILKSVMLLLLRADIKKSRKKELRKLLIYFSDIEILDPLRINWNLRYSRTTRVYEMLISICRLVVKGLLQSSSKGETKLMNFFDEQRMCKLYEKFILEYYRREFPQIEANASMIPWIVDDGVTAMLPAMKSDVMLNYQNKVLIIDAKYYSNTMQTYYGTSTIHSNNLYQIFTYVKNKESQLSNTDQEVSGMLLYAKTDEEIQPNNIYHLSGNKVTVKTLDLNLRFDEIAKQLDEIIEDHFEISKK